MGAPFFSIMMPAYNAENYIAAALDSILAQTYDDYEVIVVDDASTDSTCSIIERYAESDSRIKVYRNEKNVRNCITRRRALGKMSGRYVAFLDSDDIWESDKLERFAEVLRGVEEKRVCVHSDATIIDSCGEYTGETFQTRFNAEGRPVEGDIFEELLLTNWINMSSAVVEREALLNVGGFRELDDMVADDWDMWVRYAKGAEFYFLPQKLTRYRIHGNGISAPHQVQRVAKAREQIFANIIRMYASSLSKSLMSKIYYKRGANAVVLRFTWLARKNFFEAWINNMSDILALIRTLLGR